MPNPALDARDDWFYRVVGTRVEPTTALVWELRTRIDPDETADQTRNTLRKLEKAGLLTSEKDGRDTRWKQK